MRCTLNSPQPGEPRSTLTHTSRLTSRTPPPLKHQWSTKSPPGASWKYIVINTLIYRDKMAAISCLVKCISLNKNYCISLRILLLEYILREAENVRIRHKCLGYHDDVIKQIDFPRYWTFVKGIYRLPVDSPHKGQWRGALMFSLMCAWTNRWVNNRDASDLRRHRAHCNVIAMMRNAHHCISTWIIEARTKWSTFYRHRFKLMFWEKIPIFFIKISFRVLLGAEQTTNNYMNQRWLPQTHVCLTSY